MAGRLTSEGETDATAFPQPLAIPAGGANGWVRRRPRRSGPTRVPRLRIGFAFNLRRQDAAGGTVKGVAAGDSGRGGSGAEAAGGSAASDAGSSPGGVDAEAEWDDPDTIEAVQAALAKRGRVYLLEADASFGSRLRRARPDIVFNMAEGLRGTFRESLVPALLEAAGIPYTGSDPLALAICLHKVRAKEILRANRIKVPAGWMIEPSDPERLQGVPLPAIVKPVGEGSSKGIFANSLVRTRSEARQRVREVFERYGQPALLEEFLPGREFTAGILGNGPGARVLPLVEVNLDELPPEAPRLYGFEAKWLWDRPEAPLDMFRCPAPVPAGLRQTMENIDLAAYRTLGLRDWARIDMRLDARGEPRVLEVNPIPGILPRPEQNSCFPKAARVAGMDYATLVGAVLDEALLRTASSRHEASQAS